MTPSRASLAPTGFGVYAPFVNTASLVGARLAREEASTITADPVMKPTCLRHDVLSYAI